MTLELGSLEFCDSLFKAWPMICHSWNLETCHFLIRSSKSNQYQTIFQPIPSELKENPFFEHNPQTMAKLCQQYPGWWFQPLWKILVSWEDYPIYYGKIKNVWNHQPVSVGYIWLPPHGNFFLLNLGHPRLVQFWWSTFAFPTQGPDPNSSGITLCVARRHMSPKKPRFGEFLSLFERMVADDVQWILSGFLIFGFQWIWGVFCWYKGLWLPCLTIQQAWVAMKPLQWYWCKQSQISSRYGF